MKKTVRHLLFLPVVISVTLSAHSLAFAKPINIYDSAKGAPLSETLNSAPLAEPLVPTKETTSLEDRALSDAITAFKRRDDPADLTSLTQFLSKYPHSGWASAIQVNLGISYRHDGYFSRAIDAWKAAFREGKDATSPSAKRLVDRAIGELTRLYASLGQFDQLAALSQEIKGRSITGSATESLQVAQETLLLARKDPGHLFLCGPVALKSLIRTTSGNKSNVTFLDRYRATSSGTNLAQLGQLADQASLRHQLIFRQPGQEVPVPAVVHWKAGHFATIVGKANGRYHVQDPVFPGQELWVTPGALDAEASGYFLTSVPDANRQWRKVSLAEAKKVWGKGPTNGVTPGDAGDAPANGADGGDGLPAADNPGNPNPDADNPDDCSSCSCGGMCGYNIKEASVGVTISDTPVGYSPPIGPSAKVKITYNQREDSQPANFSFYNVSAKWTLNWLTYVIDDPTNAGASVSRYLGGGGAYYYTGYNSVSRTFSAQQTDGSTLVLQSQSPVVYKRLLRDGSVEIYSQSDGAVSFPRLVFLTQKIDPQGNVLTLNYDGQLRLTSLTDAAGRQTTFSYDLSPGLPLLVTKITDPFGRSAVLKYDSLNRLSSITDTLGLQSSVTYDANSLVDSMTTPYGTTTFSYTAPGTSSPPRFVDVTDSLGYHEREEWVEPAPIPDSGPTATIPQGMPATLTNQFLSYRNSFHWDKNAYVVAGCTPTGGCDYSKARARQFNHVPNTTIKSTSIGTVKFPLENRIWFAYGSQTQSYNDGNFNQPIAIGRVLDDGTTQLKQYTYDPKTFNLTQAIDPVGRVTTYAYSSGIDLASISQSSDYGVQSIIAQYTYNSQHRRLTYTDAALETTHFTYNAAGQLTSATNPLSQTTTYAYDPDHNLSTDTNANSQLAATYTYDAFNRVASFTDSEGWSAAFEYDAADRLTKITYPDGTTDAYTYDKLDLASFKDRESRVWKYTHDADRRLTALTDPLGQQTLLGYNDAGRLTSLTDLNSNTTNWTYDVQERLIGKQYADLSAVSYTYETTTSRLKSITDALTQVKQFSYSQDNRLFGITYLNSVNTTPNVTFVDDPFFPRRVSMTDGTGTSQYTYGSIGVDGALQLKQESSPIASSAIIYVYDELGRMSSRTVAGATAETLQYDAIGRLTGHSSDLGSFSRDYLGQTTQITLRQLLPSSSNLQTAWGYLPNSGDRRLASIDNTGLSTGEFTNLQFTTTPEKFISSITETSDNSALNPPASTQTASYNNLNQLTNLSGQTLSYDDNGNTLSDGVRNYTWDADNRLIEITYVGLSGKQTAFTYDGIGRRVSIASTPIGGGGTVTTSYLWCGERICQVRNSSNAVTREYVDEGEFIPGSPAQAFYYGIDQLGSVRRSFNSASASAYRYDPYGNELQGTSPLTDFRYAGMFYDADSGLYLTKYRVYDPVTGRWISRDPIGEAPVRNAISRTDRQQIEAVNNLYSYVANNPVNTTDPRGLWQVTIGGGFVYGGAITFGVNGGQYNFGAYVGAAEGISADYDPQDAGEHTCGLEMGIKGSYDLGTLGISSTITPGQGNSASINVPDRSVLGMSYNVLDPNGAGNPTFSAGAGGYVGFGGTFYFR